MWECYSPIKQKTKYKSKFFFFLMPGTDFPEHQFKYCCLQVFQPFQRDGLCTSRKPGADGHNSGRRSPGTLHPLHGAPAEAARASNCSEERFDLKITFCYAFFKFHQRKDIWETSYRELISVKLSQHLLLGKKTHWSITPIIFVTHQLWTIWQSHVYIYFPRCCHTAEGLWGLQGGRYAHAWTSTDSGEVENLHCKYAVSCAFQGIDIKYCFTFVLTETVQYWDGRVQGADQVYVELGNVSVWEICWRGTVDGG